MDRRWSRRGSTGPTMRGGTVRFLLAAVAVAGATEVGARVLESTVGTPEIVWYDEATQLKIEQMDDRQDAAIVVVGTSMAWQDLVPAELGRAEVLSAVGTGDQGENGGENGEEGDSGDTVYNAGLAGGVPTVMEPWLTEQVVGRLDPKVVVWGLSSLDFSDVYGDVGLDTYTAAPATRPGLLASTDRALRRHSAIFRHRSALRDPSLLIGSGRDKTSARLEAAAKALGSDGQRLDFTLASDADRALEVQARISPYRADRDDLAAVVRTVESLKARGIEVVFVELPVPPRFLALYDAPADHDQFLQLLSAAAEELDVPLLKSTQTFGDQDFVDFTHLDADGANRFSAEIASALAAALA